MIASGDVVQFIRPKQLELVGHHLFIVVSNLVMDERVRYELLLIYPFDGSTRPFTGIRFRPLTCYYPRNAGCHVNSLPKPMSDLVRRRGRVDAIGCLNVQGSE